MTSVAIVIPIYRDVLLPEEEISLRHLRQYLSGYDRYWMAPTNLSVPSGDEHVRRFEEKYFYSTDSYSRLLLKAEFYHAFSEYEFILIHQLDSLIFSDQLLEWCQAGYDYIGAPLFRSKIEPNEGFSRVGNGGLSLRKVESFLKVLQTERYVDARIPYWQELFTAGLEDLQDWPLTQRFVKRLQVLRDVRRGVRWYTSHYTLNEDLFWSDRAKLFYPDFEVAPVRDGLRFAFERFPRYCFDKNSRQLSFGCHAWAKWDREFWDPFLLS